MKPLLLALLASSAILPSLAGGYSDRLAQIPYTHQAVLPDSLLPLTPEESSAMDWLYTYMPLPDVADRSAAFFLENVRASLQARREMPWGKTVPEREFRHFVLPVRVNNENLDLSRPAFYAELRDRVKDLSMRDAILEVNHWCHEKVAYQPSDARTSAPLATVKTALGRCGEESTFTVAALRAVGIPARQVYTPRWAHTDDNHAWVEAWADGHWYFLGACEPEPILDLGWFNAPASRGMLMTTKVFGRYDGPEEILEAAPLTTVINVTEKYAPVSEAAVKVVDAAGRPAEGARVAFGVYNYAEYYPVAVRTADNKGFASLTTGRGDLLVWASQGDRYGFAKVSAAAPDTAVIVLDKGPGYSDTVDFDIVPPAQSSSLPKPTAAQIAENDRRKQQEDSIRSAYEATFATADAARQLAASLGVDCGRLSDMMLRSRGNHATLAVFLRHPSVTDKARALDLLGSISEKDLRDVSIDVLLDHYLHAPQATSAMEVEYVLSPRVENEMLTPWRSFLGAAMGGRDIKSPQALAEWVSDSIAIDSYWNPLGLRMSPQAVYEQRLADRRSRSIFYVAVARTLGFPARIDRVTGKTQYSAPDGNWTDVDFESVAEAESQPTGVVDIQFEKSGHISQPAYYGHFSISRIDGGQPRLLEYDDFALLSDIAPDGKLTLDAGDYVLTSGQRLANGSVLARSQFFTVAAGDTLSLPMAVRQDKAAVQVIGSFNSENLYYDRATSQAKSLLSTTGRGYYVLGLLSPNHEPSSHALNDIAALRSDFEGFPEKFMLLYPDEESLRRHDDSKFPAMPTTAVFGADIDGRIRAELIESLGLPDDQLPIFIIADTFNRVVFISQGYTIRLGDTLKETLMQLK